MPIADCLGHRELSYGITASGNERNISKATTWSHNMEIGFYGIGELGWDNDTLGNTVINGKLYLYQNGKSAVSAGVQNVSLDGHSVEKFVVGRYDLKCCRLHAGALWNESGHGTFGIDAPILGNCTLMVDHVTGQHACSAAAIVLPLPIKGFTVTLTGKLPANKDEGIQNSIGLSYFVRL